MGTKKSKSRKSPKWLAAASQSAAADPDALKKSTFKAKTQSDLAENGALDENEYARKIAEKKAEAEREKHGIPKRITTGS